MINSATIGQGNAKMICNVECTRKGEVCIAAHDKDKLVDCGSRITGNYTCLCSSPLRTVGAIPGIGKISKSKNTCSKDADCGRFGYCAISAGRGSCLPKKAGGALCTEDKECLSKDCGEGSSETKGKAIARKICLGNLFSEDKTADDIIIDSGTGSTGAVFTGDIKGFTPDARIVWNQLDPATQKSIIDMGKSLKEIEGIFVGCKGPGAGGCVGEKMIEIKPLINTKETPEQVKPDMNIQ
ncbi:MAG: Dickkopf N-terminal cysteine-rich domain-containing protein, partial [Nanoarchaeota archaeon]